MSARIENTTPDPDVTTAVQHIYKAVHASGLPRKIVELVHLRASQINGCSACVNAGVHSAGQGSVGTEKLLTVAAWYENPSSTTPSAPPWRSPRRRPGSPTGPDPSLTTSGPRPRGTTTTSNSGRWCSWWRSATSSTASTPPSGYPPGPAGAEPRTGGSPGPNSRGTAAPSRSLPPGGPTASRAHPRCDTRPQPRPFAQTKTADERGQLGEIALGQVGQGPFEVRPHQLGRVEFAGIRRQLEDGQPVPDGDQRRQRHARVVRAGHLHHRGLPAPSPGSA